MTRLCPTFPPLASPSHWPQVSFCFEGKLKLNCGRFAWLAGNQNQNKMLISPRWKWEMVNGKWGKQRQARNELRQHCYRSAQPTLECGQCYWTPTSILQSVPHPLPRPPLSFHSRANLSAQLLLLLAGKGKLMSWWCWCWYPCADADGAGAKLLLTFRIFLAYADSGANQGSKRGTYL